MEMSEYIRMDSIEHSIQMEESDPKHVTNGLKTKMKINNLMTILNEKMDKEIKLEDHYFPNFQEQEDDRLIEEKEDSYSCEGYLLMQKRGRSNWKKFFARINGAKFYVYKSEKDEKPNIEFDWTWIYTSKFTTREKESIVESKFLHSSTTKFQLFSNHAVRTICAPNEEDAIKWEKTFDKIIKNFSSDQQLKKKKEACDSIQKLFDEDLEQDLKKSRQIAQILAIQGFGTESRVDGCKKQGKLEMYEDYGDITKRFKEFYFILKKKYLYYNPRKEEHKTGIISLKYSTIEKCDIEGNDSDRRFKIVTPMVTYQLRAKHEVAAEEWVKALVESKLGKAKKSAQNLIEKNRSQSIVEEENQLFTNPELHIKVGEKYKKVKLKNKDIIIGRSSSCSLQLNDKHLSREHAKICFYGPTRWKIFDLGSHSGTKVNKTSVTKHLLKPGDVIEVGSTEITFRAKNTK